MKKIYIVNGVGTSGKDTFVSLVGKYISSYKYSIVDLPKQAAKVLGWNGTSKTEKDRKFLSDIMDLSEEYNDAPFKDVLSIVSDFKRDSIETEAIFIDMRDPADIERAVKTFGAETVIVKNKRAGVISSNHADANVDDFDYDYIIENNGSLDDLDNIARMFVKYVINKKPYDKEDKIARNAVASGKEAILIDNKLLRNRE